MPTWVEVNGDKPLTDSPGHVEIFSGIPLQQQFGRSYDFWMRKLDMTPAYNRKTWEFAQVIQATWQAGRLYNSRAISFGSGIEPLPSWFALMDSTVLITDVKPANERLRNQWVQTGQHCGGDVMRCYKPNVCPDKSMFKKNASFRYVDMRAIPSDLRGFDVCWSMGSLEHLGSPEAGLDFIVNSLDVLKPGGIAVHTTEYNKQPPNERLDIVDTVFYGAADLIALRDKLEAAGHKVAPLILNPGDGWLDKLVTPVECSDPHVSFAWNGIVVTSAVMVIQKGKS